jgi:subtilisin-like proprotein convertase family protein
MKNLLAGGVLSAAVLSTFLPNASSAQDFPSTRTRNFNNLTPITIADSCPVPTDEECAGLPDYHFNEGGDWIPVPIIPASLYPSPITVPPQAFPAGAKITDVNVRLKNLSHQSLDDVDIVLVGPEGQFVWLASNITSGNTTVNNINWKFDDQAKLPLPNSSSNTGRVSNNTSNARYNLIYPEWINVWTATEERTFKPSDYDAVDDEDRLPDVSGVTNTPATAVTYPDAPYNTTDPSKNPAPTVTSGPSLSVFNGKSPVGTWKLYVVDDWYWYDGSLGGWTLEITATP